MTANPEFSNNAPHVTVDVGYGDATYPIHIGSGLLVEAVSFIAPLLARPVTAIVTDSNVAEHYLGPLRDSLKKQGITIAAEIIIPPGENSKNWDMLQSLTEQLLDAGMERQDHLIALGGGVVGDLTGFAAAILRRGIPVIHIPTTLLSQVDSSVGGKTAINSPYGKNLIGAFHQPRMVIADIAALETLPDREKAAGYAEVVKYGLIGNRPFFNWLGAHAKKALAGDRDSLIQMVETCCREKAAIVAEDERETGRRALLNLGHTFAHALETATGYDGTLLHGEAVALGLVLAFDLSHRLGYCPDEDVQAVQNHLSAHGLPTNLQAFSFAADPDLLLRLMYQDKKVQAGKLRLILVRGIGKAIIPDDVDENAILATLKAANS